MGGLVCGGAGFAAGVILFYPDFQPIGAVVLITGVFTVSLAVGWTVGVHMAYSIEANRSAR